jgi:hypothetical protein
VDIDVSPLDNSGSHKEGVSRTYKGHDGYAPIFSYIGAEGYMLDCELREGRTPLHSSITFDNIDWGLKVGAFIPLNVVLYKE